MVHFSAFRNIRWPVLQCVTLGLVAAGTLPLLAPAARAQSADYGRCADDLLAAGIAADTAATACALAFNPTEVSSCVTGVTNASGLAPVSALSACSRDRRPDEVATCVTDIHQQLSVDDSQRVLESCHRSVLPELYGQCVTQLAEVIDYSTEESITRCIAAGYRPENVAPTFVPE